MSAARQLAQAGNWQAATVVHGLSIEEQASLVDRVQNFITAHGVPEMTQGDPNIQWAETYVPIFLSTATHSLRLLLWHNGSMRPLVDVMTIEGDARLCEHPNQCTCDEDNRGVEDWDREACDYCNRGSDYCTYHNLYH